MFCESDKEFVLPGRYKTLWLDVSDPDSTGDDETLSTLRQVSSCSEASVVATDCSIQ